jgi:L-seryl-tRNA(Ser) seleniumtransferase
VSSSKNPLRELPSVDRLLSHENTAPLLARFNRVHVTRECRAILDELRTSLRQGEALADGGLDNTVILARVAERLESTRAPRLQRVINATGTVLHTNLGRAVLPPAAIAAVTEAAGEAVNLEYDLELGSRGQREALVEEIVLDLTGAEAATVVNNNAAAVLLALNTLANGKEVIVSRGELIEIGGAFRLPEIMTKSGAVLREVGTTNRTHPGDYERAIGQNTALLLKVHASNYRIVGFSSEVELAALVAIGKRRNVPVMEDLGSGALVDLTRYGLPKEPVVSERIATGADIVTFSGDKVLGGPQAGLIAGRKAPLAEITSNPLHRALRCGKLTIAALAATLRLYRDSPHAVDVIPALRACARPLGEIEAAARLALPELQAALGREFRLSIEESTSQIGSGALPTEEIPTKVIAIVHDRAGADWIAGRFRRASPPIIGRIKDGAFLLDLRVIADPRDLIPHWSDRGDRGHVPEPV